VGGYCIVDDYGALSICKDAVTDFRKAHGITDEIVTVDWTGAYWKKTS
jgi:O-methyltransferase